jgi:hypothetical protein
MGRPWAEVPADLKVFQGHPGPLVGTLKASGRFAEHVGVGQTRKQVNRSLKGTTSLRSENSPFGTLKGSLTFREPERDL